MLLPTLIGVLLGGVAAAAQAADPATIAVLMPAEPANAVKAWQVFTILGYLAALGLLAYLGVRWWKRRDGAPLWTPPARQIVVSDSRRVSGAASAMVLEVRGVSYLVVCSPSAIAIQPLPEKQS